MSSAHGWPWSSSESRGWYGGERCLSLHVRWPDDVFNRLTLGLPIVLYGSYYLFPGGEGTELVGFGLDVGP